MEILLQNTSKHSRAIYERSQMWYNFRRRKNMRNLNETPGEAHQAWNSNASSFKKSLLALLVFPLMIVLGACNDTANEDTPMQSNDTDGITTPNGDTHNSGINENGSYNGPSGNGVMDGTDTNTNNGNNGTVNEGTVTDPHTIGDDIENAVDDTENTIEGAIDNDNNNGTTNNNNNNKNNK